MKNNNFSHWSKLTLSALFVICVLTLSACKQATDDSGTTDNEGKKTVFATLSDSDKLIGSWSSTYSENFIVTKDTFEAAGTYKGDSLVVLKASETAGTIFIKYTFVPDWNKGQKEKPEDTTGWTESWGSWYPQNEALIGKWYAVSYKNLTAESVSIAGAYKADGKSAAETLEEAVTEFTIENGYFGTYSECVKDAE